jgi:hypothetical protein
LCFLQELLEHVLVFSGIIQNGGNVEKLNTRRREIGDNPNFVYIYHYNNINIARKNSKNCRGVPLQFNDFINYLEMLRIAAVLQIKNDIGCLILTYFLDCSRRTADFS